MVINEQEASAQLLHDWVRGAARRQLKTWLNSVREGGDGGPDVPLEILEQFLVRCEQQGVSWRRDEAADQQRAM